MHLLLKTIYIGYLYKETTCFFVKLHSELADPTQFKWIEVGVDFVFPLSQEQEGDFTLRNCPSCLKFGGCSVGVWDISSQV